MKTKPRMDENRIELLEARIAPAGVVNISLSGGVLTVTGDGADNDFEVHSPAKGQIVIQPDATTDVGAGPGVERTLTGSVKALQADLGGGDDSFVFAEIKTLRQVSVSGGDGDDFVSLEDIKVKGSLNVSLGAGDDHMHLDGDSVLVKGNVVLDGGDGTNSINFHSPKTSISGTLTVKGGAGDDLVSTEEVSSVKVGKDFSVSLGQGANRVLFQEEDSVSTKKNLSITTGDGDDEVVVGADGTSVFVGKNLTLNLGNGENIVSQHDLATTITVKGSYRVTGGSGADSFDLSGESFKTKDLVLDAGEGVNDLALSSPSVAVKNFSITSGADTDSVLLNSVKLTIKGKLTIDTGDGNNDVQIASQNLLVKGAASFLAGTGEDVLEVAAAGRFSGAVSVDLGATGGTVNDLITQTANFTGTGTGIAFGNSLTIRSSAGAGASDELVLQNLDVHGKLNASLGDAISSAVLDDLFLHNTVNLTTGSGNDTVRFERATPSSVDSKALKLVSIETGAGDDTVLIGTGTAGVRVIFNGGLSVTDSAGTDSINDVAAANVFPPGKPPVISGFEDTSLPLRRS